MPAYFIPKWRGINGKGIFWKRISGFHVPVHTGLLRRLGLQEYCRCEYNDQKCAGSFIF